MFRVGVRGFDRSAPAKYVESVTAGLYCMWLETPSGARIDASELTAVQYTVTNEDEDGSLDIEHISIQFSADQANTRLVLDAIGGLEIVYVDADGEPLPHRPDA